MIKTIFAGRSGIRSGWRFLIFIALIVAMSISLDWLVVGVLHYKSHELWHPVDFILNEGIHFLIALAAAYVMMQVERKRWSFKDYGLNVRQNPFGLFLRGSLYGFVTPTVVMLLIYVVGDVSITGVALAGKSLLYFAILWLIAMTLLGCAEEFLFRGYPLFAIASGIGFWPASILLSLIFGGLHYFVKPLETWLDGISVTLIGLFLCLTLRRTGSLWFAIGFHAMFDYAALVLYAAPNSGNQGRPVEGAILKTTFHGPSWITGGPCGIEASALILPVLALLFMWFHHLYKRANYPFVHTPA
jgi:CAAX protease family protein